MARPLERHGRDGRRYTRPPSIEVALDVALTQDAATLRRRASVTDKASADYLPAECLVGVIREARWRGDDATMNLLLPMLLRRCEANLGQHVPETVPNAENVRGEILAEFAVLFAEDGTPEGSSLLDFYEVRFNSAFRALRIDLLRREEARAEREESFVDQDEDDADDEGRQRLASAFGAAKQEDGPVADDLLAAIDALPPDERRAVIVCHILDYDEESEDPDKLTAAKLCGVSGRTIRNRLTRAAAKLSKFLKEEE